MAAYVLAIVGLVLVLVALVRMSAQVNAVQDACAHLIDDIARRAPGQDRAPAGPGHPFRRKGGAMMAKSYGVRILVRLLRGGAS